MTITRQTASRASTGGSSTGGSTTSGQGTGSDGAAAVVTNRGVSGQPPEPSGSPRGGGGGSAKTTKSERVPICGQEDSYVCRPADADTGPYRTESQQANSRPFSLIYPPPATTAAPQTRKRPSDDDLDGMVVEGRMPLRSHRPYIAPARSADAAEDASGRLVEQQQVVLVTDVLGNRSTGNYPTPLNGGKDDDDVMETDSEDDDDRGTFTQKQRELYPPTSAGSPDHPFSRRCSRIHQRRIQRFSGTRGQPYSMVGR